MKITTRSAETIATVKGLVAIVLWSTAMSVSRTAAESIGTFATGAIVCLGAGIIALAVNLRASDGKNPFAGLSWAYLAVCGSLFFIYTICLYLAVGFAESRSQVLVLAIVNYLWPAFMVVLMIPVLGYRARPMLAAGLGACIFGMILAVTGGDLHQLLPDLAKGGLPMILMFAGAVSWSLYSVYSRKLAVEKSSAVPLFFIVSGLVLGAVSLLLHEKAAWSLRVAGELVFMAIFPSSMAYMFWEEAMYRGNMVLVGVAANAIPVLSTACSVLYLHVKPAWGLWAGALLVAAGAAVSKKSVWAADGQ